jgi:carbohydrate kinase (thermoresistant glucokinase family)
MSEGEALNDEDRFSWLIALNTLGKEHQAKGAVIACSALKEKYRDIIAKDLVPAPVWIYLEGSYDLILERLEQRSGHFMPADLLKSQFDVLEPPKNAIYVSIVLERQEIIREIMGNISQ